MATDLTYPYIARLILAGRVVQTLEFEAADDRAAWLHALPAMESDREGR